MSAPSQTTLRFDRRLYLESALRETMDAFSEHAELSLDEVEGGWTLSIAAPEGTDRRALIGELGNYALGLTVQAGGVREEGA